MDAANNSQPAGSQSVNLQPGTILSSDKRNYKVAGVLGSGGYGVTYLAKGKVRVDNVTVEGMFAIKELFPCEFARRIGQAVVPDPNHVAEFARSKSDFLLEATRLQKISTNHENIVRVNEIFEANGTAYYVMQHINGQTIYDYVGQYGPLSYDYAIQLLTPVFGAIEYLHQNRINHFDIKPDNIMLQQSDEGIVPILIDFGLSIHFKKNGDKTTPKSFYGLSEGYAPIEQYAEIKSFSPASDVYSLAATLVFMLTGVAPTPAPALKIVDLRSKLFPVAPPQVVEAICHAMAKSDDARTQSISQFYNDLTSPAPMATPSPVPEVVERPTVTMTETTAEETTPSAYSAYRSQQPGNVGPQPFSNAQQFGNAPQQFGNGSQPPAVPLGYPVSTPPGPALKPVPAKPVKNGGMMWILVVVVALLLAGGGFAYYYYQKSFKETVNVASESIRSASSVAYYKLPTDTTTKDTTKTTTIATTTTTTTTTGGKTTPPPPPPSVEVGTVSLGNGTYTGELLHGKPHGKGKVRFTSEGKVASNTSEWALPGYTMDASYVNGQLEMGRLYDESGKLIKTIIP